MSRRARIAYVAMISLFCVMTVLAMATGLWFYAVLGLIFGGLFAYTAPFVFGKRWQAPPPAPTRRPVRRRAK